jgi:hypothetical protein
MAFTNLEKTDMVLIYGEARGHLELPRQIYCERFPQRILPNARTFVNVVQHLRNVGRFEMSKRDLGHQREEERILVAEEEILHETENGHEQVLARHLANHLAVSQFASSKHRSGNSLKQRHLNRIRLS